MSDENQIEESEDLELAQRILEMTAFIQQNAQQIEELGKTIADIQSRTHEYEVELGSKFTELNTQLDKKIEGGLDDIKQQLSNQESGLEELRTTTQEQFSDLDQKLKDQDDKLQEQGAQIGLETQEREKTFTTLGEQIQGEAKERSEVVSALEERVEGETQERVNDISSLKEETRKIAQDLSTKVVELKTLTQTHSQTLNDITVAIKTFKENLQEIITLSKKDQQAHFENFSRMLESFNENIHTELTLTAQNLRESDIEILNEVAEHYTRKKVGEELQHTITKLSEELQAQNTRARDELTNTLQKSVEEYEMMIEKQSKTMQDYKNELERIQSEIQAVIDRKVNEKYEAVFSLLATVAVHAEELMMQVKAAEIHIPSEISSESILDDIEEE